VNWLDDYIYKNDTGYLINDFGGLFVDVGDDYVKHVKGNTIPNNLKEISKSEFINKLIHSGEGQSNFQNKN
jgi:hypothetical protein